MDSPLNLLIHYRNHVCWNSAFAHSPCVLFGLSKPLSTLVQASQLCPFPTLRPQARLACSRIGWEASSNHVLKNTLCAWREHLRKWKSEAPVCHTQQAGTCRQVASRTSAELLSRSSCLKASVAVTSSRRAISCIFRFSFCNSRSMQRRLSLANSKNNFSNPASSTILFHLAEVLTPMLTS